MKKFAVIALALLIAASLTGCKSQGSNINASSKADSTASAPQTAGSKKGYKNYSSEQLKISMDIPEGWRSAAQNSEAMINFLPPDFPETTDNIAVIAAPNIGETVSTMENGDSIKSQFEADYTDVKISSFKKTTVDGSQAVSAKIECKFQGTSLTQLVCYINKSGTLYQITYTSVNTDLTDAFTTGLSSFKFTK